MNKKQLKKAAFAAVLSFLCLLFSSCHSLFMPTPVAEIKDLTPDYKPSSVMKYVPGGTFTQYDPGGTGSFDHTVSPFYLDRYEVTYELWYFILEWANKNGYNFAATGYEGSTYNNSAPTFACHNEPATRMSWKDAVAWCNAYSRYCGLAPVYFSGGLEVKEQDCASYSASWSANGFRLPSEGEWECAARYIDGSSWTPYDYASGSAYDYTYYGASALVAWFNYNSGGITHDAGQKAANALGIYDMSGNVDEYCWDWIDYYPYGPRTDYRGPGGGTYRSGRGGSFSGDYAGMQLGTRYFYAPYSGHHYCGFRVARTGI